MIDTTLKHLQKHVFRKDINGIRALAVLAVLIFHFNQEWLPAGFAGVDVFFVISGYLMTRIILEKLQGSNFSLLNFYQSRAKRILPALLATVIACLGIGFLFLDPATYKTLGTHAASSLLFVSNIVYFTETGYFDQSAISKILLHTWSLSVEWQFYLIYPLALMLSCKYLGLQKTKSLLLPICISLFAISATFSYTAPNAAYYMLYTRAWELLLGALAYLTVLPPFLNRFKYAPIALETLGIVLIISSLFIIDKNSPWPGIMALLPVLGTYLCIISQNQNISLFSPRPIQYLGLISYSVYLVHWPILAFANRLNIDINFVLYLAFSLLLGALSYHVIETRRNLKSILVVFTLALAASAFVFYNGVASRVSDSRYHLSDKEFHLTYYGGIGYDGKESQTLNADNDTIDLIVYGDSFAWQYAHFIDKSKIPTLTLWQNSCMSLPDIFHTGLDKDKCLKQYTDANKILTQHKGKAVIIAHNWERSYSTFLNRADKSPHIRKENADWNTTLYDQLLRQFNEWPKHHTYFLIAQPIPSPNPITFKCLASIDLLGNRLLNKQCPHSQERKDHPLNTVLRDVAAKFPHVHYIAPNESLCDDAKCITIINGNPVYSDANHFSRYGADIVGRYIFDEISKIHPTQNP